VELGKYSLFLEGRWLVASCEVFANKLPLRGPKLALATPIDNIFVNHYTKREHISVAQSLPPRNEVSSNDEVSHAKCRQRHCKGLGWELSTPPQ
jgi:hypothetical protein